MEMAKISAVVKQDAASVGKGLWNLTASTLVWLAAASGEMSQVNKRRVAKLIDDAGVPEGTRKYIMNLVGKGFAKWKGAVVLDATPAEARSALADALKAEYSTLENMRKAFLPAKADDGEETDQEVAGKGDASETAADETIDNGTKVVNFLAAHAGDLTREQCAEIARIVTDRLAEIDSQHQTEERDEAAA